jgi:tetratricopeptide (TPR) repeat protein
MEQYRQAKIDREHQSTRPTYKSLLLGVAGTREDAEWVINMMLEKNPRDGMALCARFEIARTTDQDEAALHTAELLAEVQQGDGFNLLKAAKLLNEKKNFPAAATLFGLVAERSEPNPDLLGYLGTSRLSSGDPDGAREAFLGVIKLRPDDPRAPFYLGNIALLQGNEREAREYYSRSLEVNEHFVPPLVNLARYLASKGRQDEAEAVLTDALERRPGDPGATELLQQIRNQGSS